MGATDLGEAAHTALLKVRELRDRLEESKEACEQGEDRLQRWTESLDQDRTALHDAVDHLGKAVEAKTQQMLDNVAEAEKALGEITQECATVGTQADQILDLEAAADGELAHHLDEMGPRITALAEAAETASKEAIERAGAIADALAEATQGIEQILGAFAGVLEEMAHAIQTTGTSVRSLLEDLAPSLLADKEKDFEEKTGEVRTFIDEELPHLQEHASAVADYSVDKMEDLLDHALDAIEPEERELENDLQELATLAGEKHTDIDQAGDALEKQMAANVGEAKTLAQALEDVRGRWALFGFNV